MRGILGLFDVEDLRRVIISPINPKVFDAKTSTLAPVIEREAAHISELVPKVCFAQAFIIFNSPRKVDA
jgi:hypothetical protein